MKITGNKVAWAGLGILFGVSHFILDPTVLLIGAAVLIIGVIMIIIDK